MFFQIFGFGHAEAEIGFQILASKIICNGEENYEMFQNYWWKQTLDVQFYHSIP